MQLCHRVQFVLSTKSMDVTNGLISRLVKSKSTERVLAPIASQVSLLMILNEVEGEESVDGSALNVSACVERVSQAVDGFIQVGQDQRHRSSDPMFDAQMNAACETLELAKSELFVAGQGISGSPANARAHSMLVNAAKYLLQAVLKVLIVVDDVEVRRCVQALSVVEDKVRNICSLSDSQGMVSAFKELTEALLYMTMLVSRRQKDLVSGLQRDELMAGLSLMHKGVSSLRMAVQTHLKYPNNAQAAAGKQQVLDQVLANLSDMRTVLESGPPSDLEVEEAGHFVDHIDKVLEGLDEGHRFDLNANLESWVASIVRHAMGVGHLCQGTYRHLITRTCQRILQSKFRLFELQQSIMQSPHLPEIRLDFEGVCEVLLDEFCELEKHVNMALLNLIIDTCCFTFQPLEHLASAAIHQQELGANIEDCELGQDFIEHGEKLSQVAAMASASSMDPRKVRAIKLASRRLEQLFPEVLPAVGTVARHHGNAAAVRHLKSLVQDWSKEAEALVHALDSMMDPVVFLEVTEQRMRQGVNVVRGKVYEGDEAGARAGLQKLLAHARRMSQVATRVVDHHCDALFRNGLLVFVRQLEAARRGVKEAGHAVLEDLSHARVVDTLHRRLGLLLDAVADVRHGVKGENHVDVLNPARRTVRRQPHVSDNPVAGGRNKRTPADRPDPDSAPPPAEPPSLPTDRITKSTEQPREAPPPTITTTTTTTTSPTPQDVDITPTAMTSSDHACPAVPAKEGPDQGQRSGDVKKKKSSSRQESVDQQKGETSMLVQSCGDGLVLSALKGEKREVGTWNGDVLSWTSHLGEVALSLLSHCHQASRKSEMQQLTVEMDRLAPLVMEAARFVSAGDHGQANALRLLTDDWVNACRRLVIVVDVTVGDWLLLMESIIQAVNDQDTQALKSLSPPFATKKTNMEVLWVLTHQETTIADQNPWWRIVTTTEFLAFQLSVVDRNQREMNQLMTRAKHLEGKHVPRGSDIVQFFQEAQPELENLTATLKTAADCLAATGDSNTVNKTQLNQRGREWCVLMTCLVSELDFVADALSTAGVGSLGIPAIGASPVSSARAFSTLQTKVVPLLQAETTRLKAILATLMAGGDAVVKKRSEDLSQCLSDILKEVLEIAQTSVDDTTLPQAQLFARLDAGLARSRWTEKAIEAEQFVHRHCHRYSMLISNLLFASVPAGSADGVPTEVAQLQAKVKVVSQRALQAIQLSSDLQKRATVRRCLDDLTALMPTVTEAATDYASGIWGEKSQREVQKASTEWGAKVHCLLTTLQSMSDIKPSAVTELEKQLNAQPLETSTATPATQVPSLGSSTSFADSHTPSKGPQFHPRHAAPSGQTPQPAPAVFTQRENSQTPAQARERDALDEAGTPGVTMSPYRRSALYTSWLASSRYLGEEVVDWKDSSNHFVQLVRTMAQHCQRMADFARGGTSLKDSEEVARTGLSLAASGKELEKFARSVLAMYPGHRSANDLQKEADKILTFSNQLHIVASVLHNAPGHPQGDCILARNAANLVDAVRHMFSIAEGISVSGLPAGQEDSETVRQVVDLLTHWQCKLAAYRVQQTHIPQVDDLGLRRIEVHNPPSLTTILDQRD